MHLSPILCPHGQPQQRACLFPPFVIMLSVLSLHLSIHIRKYNSFSNFCIVQLCVENSYKTNIKCTGMHYLSFIPFFACRGLVLHFFFCFQSAIFSIAQLHHLYITWIQLFGDSILWNAFSRHFSQFLTDNITLSSKNDFMSVIIRHWQGLFQYGIDFLHESKTDKCLKVASLETLIW